ncbi:MAG: hypothetical protein DKINENOH_02905 [bacterium]|nr:hypothetical protein [bacterium]
MPSDLYDTAACKTYLRGDVYASPASIKIEEK